MKKTYFILLLNLFFLYHAKAQGIDPINLPYANFGNFGVTEEINNNPYLITCRPEVSTGNFPIVIFGCGANALFSNDINLHTYDIFLKHLTSYGYIVLITNRLSGGTPDNKFKIAINWAYNKKADASHWINKLADTSNIIVMGHSFGGVNASELVSTDFNKVDAVVYLASYPFISPIFGQDVTKYKNILLSISGSEDNTTTYDEAIEGYNAYSDTICKTFIQIKGAGHAAFGNYENSTQKIGSIGRENATATIRHLIVSFLEGKIKNSSIGLENFYSTTRLLNTIDSFRTTCDTSFLVSSLTNNFKTISIYPNPVKDEFNLDINSIVGKDISLKIYSETGAMIYETRSATKTINIQTLNRGLYFIVLESGKDRWLGKIFKE